MNIPASIRAGSTIKWREDSQVDPFGEAIQSTGSWAMKFYLRTNTASEGHTANAVQRSGPSAGRVEPRSW